MSVGSAVHTYDGDKLRLLFVSPLADERIRSMVPLKSCLYVAAGASVSVVRRGMLLASWQMPHGARVVQLIALGEHVLSLDSGGSLRVWETRKPGVQYAQLELESFAPTVMAHPATYLNKILIGSASGALRLYNVRTLKCVYEFASLNSAIRCIEQSPALDVLAIGLADGRLVLRNVLTDETVRVFAHADSPVLSVAFRTDGVPTLVTGSTRGRLAVWNLDAGALVTTMHNAHAADVSFVAFYREEPILITAAADNALRMWIFDAVDGSARQLKVRDGHARPPTRLRFYDVTQMLSCGQDRALRLTSIARDSQNTELSQGPLASRAAAAGKSIEDLRLASCLELDAAPVKERLWDNVVSCHANDSAAYTWRWANRALGAHRLQPGNGVAPSPVKAVCLSACGHFALLGTSAGRVFKFNMQSGRERGEFGAPAAHAAPVTALAVDALNASLLSTGLDGAVHFWSLARLQHEHTLQLGVPVAAARLHRDSNLLALACDDLVLRLVDIETRRVVRRFEGHANRITDLALSPDARWLVSAAMDATVRVWDLPCGRCIDVVRFDQPVTALAMSPDGAFLATSHVHSNGIYLWANRAHFADVSLAPLPDDVPLATLPVVVVVGREAAPSLADGEAAAADAADASESGSELSAGEAPELEPKLPSLAEAAAKHSDRVALRMGLELQAHREAMAAPASADSGPSHSLEPRGEGLVTLSPLPPSRWMHLAKLDLVRARNKPIEPPKAPVLAPFFLPTLPGVAPKFDLSAAPSAAERPAADSRLIRASELTASTPWVRALCSGSGSALMALTKTMSPSAVEFEVRSLAEAQHVAMLVDALLAGVRSRSDWELYQVLLQLTLACQRDCILAQPELFAPRLAELQAELDASWDVLDGLFNSLVAMIRLFRGV